MLFTILFRLASNDNELFVQLKIPNAIERKKISLRAMDVVLFGDLRSQPVFELYFYYIKFTLLKLKVIKILI